VALGAVAGFIDAVSFSSLFAVFPANQSGNAVLLGVGIGDTSATAAWRPAAAMVGFAVGVLVAVTARRSGRVPAPTRVLVAVELVLVVVVAVAVGPLLDVDRLLGGLQGAVLLVVTSVAMGVQTEVIRVHAGVSLSTTYQTGALTTIAEDVSRTASRRGPADAHLGGAIGVLATVLVGYIAGAALGARLGGSWNAALAIPVVVLLALLVTEPWWNRPPAPRPSR
jgi:uncharacterized membrane protein YoaK (UPF0700 family)